MSARPPSLARWLLHRVLPEDMRDEVIGDLDEIFARRAATGGRGRTVAWYCWQIALFPLHLFVERWRTGNASVSLGFGMSWIDFKLAVRMLARYPGLTLVGVLGMAVGIAISAASFAFGYRLLDPSLPVDEGDRIVSILNWDSNRGDSEPRVLHDFLAWRGSLTSVQLLGAFRSVSRNLVGRNVQPELVPVAEMSASGFAVARVPALVGRHLHPGDEQPAAPDVAVIGEDLWRRRFGGDSRVLGQAIQLGSTTYTIVGIMPQGFAFPVNHSAWVPLRLPLAAEPLSGPPLRLFARLAPGVDLEAVQSELDAYGRQAAAASPKTHERLRPKVVRYTHAFTDMGNPENAVALRAIQTLIVLVLMLVSVNVAILVYARTATRTGEIAVRTALGASRRRIVMQLFIEAAVLAGVAAVVGTMLVTAGLRYFDESLRRIAVGLPYWMTFTLPWEGVAFIACIALLAAVVVGVAPALKVTGRRVQSQLHGLSAGSGSQMRMGRLWTFLIVAQVAAAVAVLPATVHYTWATLKFRTGDLGLVARESLTSQIALDQTSGIVPSTDDEQAFRSHFGRRYAELERAVERESAVAAMTFSLAAPGGELAAVIDVEGISAPVDPVDYNVATGSRRGHLVRFNRVATDFFPAYSVPILAGRGFGPADAAPSATSVLVNRAFAVQFFGEQNPLGRRIRYVGSSREAGEGHVVLERWFEIVGVVSDFPSYAMRGNGQDARVYHAAEISEIHPARLTIRVHGTDARPFAVRVREIAAAVDPALQLRDVATSEDAVRSEQGIMRIIGLTLAAVTLSVIFLAAAGIYALMSVTVERRRKEIGIRAALGADPKRILASVFSRVFAQLGSGAALGIVAAIGLEGLLEGEAFQGNGTIVLPIVAVVTTIVGLVAAWGPARRGLRIQPIEALREE